MGEAGAGAVEVAKATTQAACLAVETEQAPTPAETAGDEAGDAVEEEEAVEAEEPTGVRQRVQENQAQNQESPCHNHHLCPEETASLVLA